MTLVLDILLIVFLFVVFGLIHSLLASLWFKEKLVESMGNKIAFYRVFYNVISVILFVAVYTLMPKPDLIIYDLQFPYDIIILGFQFLSLLGLVYTGLKINGKEFLGYNQIMRYINNQYNIEKLDEEPELRKDGIFGFTRHPIYLFSILFLGLRPYMDLFYLVFFSVMVLYFYIGSYFEEKKLVKIFGDEYINYQKQVPGIIPVRFFKNKS